MTEAETRNEIETTEPAGNVVSISPSGDEKPDPLATASQFIKDHPLLVIAGGIAVGAVAAALLPKGTGRKMVRRAATLAEAASAASLLLGKTAWARAEDAGHDLREYGSAAGDRIERLGGAAANRVQEFLAPAGSVAARTGQRIAEKATELTQRVKR